MAIWTVPPPDFTISTATGMATVAAGATTSYTVYVTGTPGFTATVVFDAPGLPAGITASFNPPSVPGSGSTTMSVTASAGSGGYYVISARGTSNALPQHITDNMIDVCQRSGRH